MNYVLGPLLAEGGCGSVYTASARGPDGYRRHVAIKVQKGISEEEHARLLDEARFSAMVPHRAVVPVEDVIAGPNGPMLVMPLVVGVDLATAAGGAPVPFRVVAAVLAEVAAALHAGVTTVLDERPLRLVHRDIKPQNIVLTAAGEVRVVDFGIARADGRARSAKTQSGQFVGTPGYVPIEVDDDADPATDVFALAVTGVRLLVGQRLALVGTTERDQARRVAAAARLLEERGVPFDARTLFEDMLAFDARRRPSAGEVARLLQAAGSPSELEAWAEPRVTQALARRVLEPGPLTGRSFGPRPRASMSPQAVLFGLGLAAIVVSGAGTGGLALGVAAAWEDTPVVSAILTLVHEAHARWHHK